MPRFLVMFFALLAAVAARHAMTNEELRESVTGCRSAGWKASSAACAELQSWNTSAVTDMSDLFARAAEFNMDISSWDTRSVTSMAGMFKDATTFNGDLSAWKTGNVVTIDSMFDRAWAFEGSGISNWDTSRVKIMANAFKDAESFDSNLARWDTSAVQDMSALFEKTVVFTGIGIEDWNTSSVTNMLATFHWAEAFNADISRWDTRNVVDFRWMFTRCFRFNQDISRWNTSSVVSMRETFHRAHAFNQSLAGWDVSRVTDMAFIFKETLTFKGEGLSTWDTSSVVDFRSAFTDAPVFNGDLSTWNTDSALQLKWMFVRAPSFTSDLSRWNTSKVDSFHAMFDGATAFEGGGLEHWDARKVDNMKEMFRGASVFNADLSRWDTGRVTSMEALFSGCRKFDSDLSRWSIAKITTMRHMFRGTAKFNHPLGTWDLQGVTNMAEMFAGAAAFEQDLSRWATSDVADMRGLFSGAAAFNSNLTGWDTAKVTDMSGMFAGASKFTSDLSRWETGRVVGMEGMFDGAQRFDSALTHWDTRRVTSLERTFAGAAAFTANLSHFVTVSVTDMRSTFAGATAFNGDVTSWATGRVTSMAGMFTDASVFNQHLSTWDTSQVREMDAIFAGATEFNGDIRTWDTSALESMRGAFTEAAAFNQNLSQWDSSLAPGLEADSALFLGCPKLSMNDVDECLEGRHQTSPACACFGEGNVLSCTNTDGSFLCACEEPAVTSCPSNATTLLFSHAPVVECAFLAAGCSALRVYTCSGETGPGAKCSSEFEGLRRLCEAGGDVVLPATFEGFRTGTSYALDAVQVQLLMESLHLDARKLADSPTLHVEIAAANDTSRWLCGGEPDEAHFTLGADGFGAAVPMLYLGLSTMLTVANDAVINLREAIEARDVVKILVMLLGVGLEVVGGSLLVSGIDQVDVSTGDRMTGWCSITGTYDGMAFELGQRCGGLETTQRLGVVVHPMCRQTTVMTRTGLYIAVADILFGVAVLIAYGRAATEAVKKFFRRGKDEGDSSVSSGTTDESKTSDEKVRLLEAEVQQQREEIRVLRIKLDGDPGRSLVPSPPTASQRDVAVDNSTADPCREHSFLGRDLAASATQLDAGGGGKIGKAPPLPDDGEDSSSSNQTRPEAFVASATLGHIQAEPGMEVAQVQMSALPELVVCASQPR